VLHVDAEDPSKAITKADLRTLLKRTAYALQSRYGIGKNGADTDIVLVISTGHWMLPNLCYATIAAGGIFSASSPATTPQELAGQYRQGGATLLICSSELRPVALAAAKILALPTDRVLMLGDGRSFALQQASSKKLIPLSPKSLDWERISDPSVLSNRTICVLFSSGTTGLPKGVRLSHRNLVAEAIITIEPNKEYHARARTGFVYRTLAHLPAAHIAGIQGYLVNPQYYGGTVYWMRRFDIEKFLEYNEKYKITSLFSVPPVFMAIARHPAVKDQFESLDWAVCGAAPLSKELQAAVKRKLRKTVVSQTWGLSETTGSMTVCPRDQAPDVEGSVSMLVPNGEARIVDDEGRDVEVGARGEIWVRGPNVTEGYWKNDKANQEAFVDGGWFRTGDVGYFKGGLFFIVDRKKASCENYPQRHSRADADCCLSRSSSNTRVYKWHQLSWRAYSSHIQKSKMWQLSGYKVMEQKCRGALPHPTERLNPLG
jgi:4-coumarate--CoA ligase